MVELVFTDRVAKLAEHCKPIKVIVTTKVVDDRYYIEFDATKSYSLDEWGLYWDGFDRYVTAMALQHGFKVLKFKRRSDFKISIFVGTLFDFLINHGDSI